MVIQVDVNDFVVSIVILCVPCLPAGRFVT